MAGLGIAIGVDAQKVRDAKRDVDTLNRTLRETEEYNLEVGKDGLDETQKLLKRLGDELRRLKGFAREGEKAGGILNAGQFKEAGKLSRDILGNFEKYHDQIKGATREMWRLVDAQAKLQDLSSDPKTSAAARSRYIDQIGALDDRIKAAQERRDALLKHQGKFGAIAEEAVDATGQIGGFGRFGAGSLQRQIRRALGWGLGIAGVTSLTGFLHGSLTEAAEYADLYAPARMRGVGRGEARHGYSQRQTLAIADSLNQTTALAGEGLDTLTEHVQTASRAFGQSADLLAGYAAAVFRATNVAPGGRRFDQVYNLMANTGTVGRGGEFLQTNQGLVERIAASVGGAMTPAQEAKLLELQAALWSRPGQIGKGSSGANIIDIANNAIIGGGQTRGPAACPLARLRRRTGQGPGRLHRRAAAHGRGCLRDREGQKEQPSHPVRLRGRPLGEGRRKALSAGPGAFQGPARRPQVETGR